MRNEIGTMIQERNYVYHRNRIKIIEDLNDKHSFDKLIFNSLRWTDSI